MDTKAWIIEAPGMADDAELDNAYTKWLKKNIKAYEIEYERVHSNKENINQAEVFFSYWTICNARVCDY